jgi:hypothetical protein
VDKLAVGRPTVRALVGRGTRGVVKSHAEAATVTQGHWRVALGGIGSAAGTWWSRGHEHGGGRGTDVGRRGPGVGGEVVGATAGEGRRCWEKRHRRGGEVVGAMAGEGRR